MHGTKLKCSDNNVEKAICILIHTLAYASTALPSSGVPVVSVSLLLHDVVGSGHALMEVMKETAVSVIVAHLSSKTKYTFEAQFILKFELLIVVSCGTGAFQCSNLQCIRSSDRGDGTQDYTDGSDEIGCGKLCLISIKMCKSA